MSHTTIPRRTVLFGATAVGLGAAAGFRIPPGEARAPIVNGQVPYFYRFMIGKFQATVVSDGRCRWERHPLRRVAGTPAASSRLIASLITDRTATSRR
jgi:hypothetical protein